MSDPKRFRRGGIPPPGGGARVYCTSAQLLAPDPLASGRPEAEAEETIARLRDCGCPALDLLGEMGALVAQLRAEVAELRIAAEDGGRRG